MPTIMFSKEGVTQGGPIAMFCYGSGILPMIRQLKALYPDLNQPWYADDTGALKGPLMILSECLLDSWRLALTLAIFQIRLRAFK
jgi:hypothetical protein